MMQDKRLYFGLYHLMVLILSSFLFLCSQSPKKEEWVRKLGGTDDDDAHAVLEISSGGFLVAGTTGLHKVKDGKLFLIKTDQKGNPLWTKKYGEIKKNKKAALAETIDECFLIGGTAKAIENKLEKFYVVKTDKTGQVLWEKEYGEEEKDMELEDIETTSDGGFIIAGTTNTDSNEKDFCLVKADKLGNPQWTQIYNEMECDWAKAVLPLGDDGYIIAGMTSSSLGGHTDILLVKTDINGNSVWKRKYGGDQSDAGQSIVKTLDGGYIIAGNTSSFQNTGPDFYITKITNNGDLIWEKTFGGKGAEEVGDIRPTAGGGYIIVGWSGSFPHNEPISGFITPHIYVVKIDEDGNEQWFSVLGPTQSFGASIQQTKDGSYIVAGMCTGSDYSALLALLK